MSGIETPSPTLGTNVADTAAELEEADDEPEWTVIPTMDRAPDEAMGGPPCDPWDCVACRIDLHGLSANLPHEEQKSLAQYIKEQMAIENADARYINIAARYAAIRARHNDNLERLAEACGGGAQAQAYAARMLPPWNAASVRQHEEQHQLDPVHMSKRRIQECDRLISIIHQRGLLRENKFSGEIAVDSKTARVLMELYREQRAFYKSIPEEMAFGPKFRSENGMAPPLMEQTSERVAAHWAPGRGGAFRQMAPRSTPISLGMDGTAAKGVTAGRGVDDDVSEGGDDGDNEEGRGFLSHLTAMHGRAAAAAAAAASTGGHGGGRGNVIMGHH